MRLISVLFSIFFLAQLTSCGGHSREKKDVESLLGESVVEPEQVTPVIQDFFFDLDESGIPMKRVLASPKDRENCFIVISKVHPEHLNVYEVQGPDTVLLASYPVCIAKNRGQKQVRGDNKTPESYPGPPFSITQIQDASSWHHDFGDGRGSIPAYGHWFMRLAVPGHSGIGIHGSTNNRESLKVGRGSEGCIRLLDEDIIHLRDNYAFVGMKVTILPEDHGPLSFERKALKQFSRKELPKIEEPAVKPGLPDTVSMQDTKKKASILGKFKKKDKEAESKAPAEPEIIKTWPDSVTVKGSRQRLRLGPDPDSFGIYENGKGAAICPEEGENLPCLGEEGNYYKVLFQNKTLFINKSSVLTP